MRRERLLLSMGLVLLLGLWLLAATGQYTVAESRSKAQNVDKQAPKGPEGSGQLITYYGRKGADKTVIKASNRSDVETPATGRPAIKRSPSALYLQEDFENVTFPPTGWDTINTDPGYGWFRGKWSGGGTYAALVTWHAPGYIQDEWLLTPEIDVSGASSDLKLEFWMLKGYTYPHDFKVYVSTDGGANFTEVWDSYSVPYPEFEYYHVTVDLGAYAGGGNIIIGFQYYGEDADLFCLDDISISDDAGEVTPGRVMHNLDGYRPTDKGPIGTQWHELAPNFCTNWTLTSWQDTNIDNILGYCDIVDFTDAAGNKVWEHVVNVTTTITITPIDDPGPEYYYELLNPPNPLVEPITEAMGTEWFNPTDFPAESFFDVYTIAWWEDPGNGILDSGDFIGLEDPVGWVDGYEVVDVCTDITTRPVWPPIDFEYDDNIDGYVPANGDPRGTYWQELYPNYDEQFVLTEWIGDQDGKLSYGDTVKLENTHKRYCYLWKRVEWVTLTAKLSFEVDTFYMDYMWQNPDVQPIANPTYTFWQEVRPTFGVRWMATNWWDDGSAVLDAGDSLTMMAIDGVDSGVVVTYYMVDWRTDIGSVVIGSLDTCDYYKPQYPDYAPQGMPDFDQKQDDWFCSPGEWNHCGPAAVANCLWWFDSKFETSPVDPRPFYPGPGNPAPNDNYPLVTAYGPWDDHDTNNVVPLITQLGTLMKTCNGWWHGTNIDSLVDGTRQFIANAGLAGAYRDTLVYSPTFEYIKDQVLDCQDVILLLGFYAFDGVDTILFGGHYVTVAGICTHDRLLCISDPWYDMLEGEPGAGTVHSETEHNDADNISGPHSQIQHDPYHITLVGISSRVQPVERVDRYPITATDALNFQGMNLAQGVIYPGGDITTTIEYAYVICPDTIPEPPKIQIERIDDGYLGSEVEVSITTENSWLEMGGFDFLISYDASGLSLQEVTEGQLLEDCDWEYFVYRYSAGPDTCLGCASGLMRIVAVADINDGANHPSCYGPPDTDPHELAKMKFEVTRNITYEGQSIPIRFFWGDCGDNTISSVDGNMLYVDLRIYDFEDNLIWDEDDDVTYPEPSRPDYLGTPDTCLDKDASIVRLVHYYDGVVTVPTSEFYDIPTVYANIATLETYVVNVWGEYVYPGDSKLVTDYVAYKKRQKMPPNSVMLLDGALPDSGYFFGGAMIVTGMLSTTPNPHPGHPEDSLLVRITATSYKYIDSGYGTSAPAPSPPHEIDQGWRHELPDYAECDPCKFAILVSGGVDGAGNAPEFWTELELLYQHKIDNGYCPENIEVIYYDGESDNTTAIPQDRVRSATQANIAAAHSEIAAKIAECHRQGKKSTVQKYFGNHGSPDGICLLGENELTGDELRQMQDTLIDSCCSVLYDELTCCYGGGIVDDLQGIDDQGKTEIHANSAAGSGTCAWGDPPNGILYLRWKLYLLSMGYDYEEAVARAMQEYYEDLAWWINWKQEKIDSITAALNDPLSSLTPQEKKELEKRLANLIQDKKDEQASLDEYGTSFYRIQFKEYCEWRLVAAPAGGQLWFTFDGGAGCGNVTVYEVQPDGTEERVRTWNWNLEGSLGYDPGNEFRVLDVPETSTGLFWIHNDDSSFTVTVESLSEQLTTEDPSNQSDFVAPSIGANDGSSAEFGEIYGEYHYSAGVDEDGFNLSDVPAMLGESGVGVYVAQFTATGENQWWEDMELHVDIIDVHYPGTLEIGCPAASKSVKQVYIDTTGEYVVPLGSIDASAPFELTFNSFGPGKSAPDADDPVGFEWDCWSMQTLVSTYSESCCELRADLDHNGTVDIADILYYVEWSFGSPPGPAPVCEEPEGSGYYPEADLDASGINDIADILYFVEYSFGSPPGPAPIPCP